MKDAIHFFLSVSQNILSTNYSAPINQTGRNVLGSGFGSGGRKVVSDLRGPRFKSSH